VEQVSQHDSLPQLIDSGLTFNIDETTNVVTIYNNNCMTLSGTDNLELNVGINFDIICNQ
jgi:hypothetical protein